MIDRRTDAWAHGGMDTRMRDRKNERIVVPDRRFAVNGQCNGGACGLCDNHQCRAQARIIRWATSKKVATGRVAGARDTQLRGNEEGQ